METVRGKKNKALSGLISLKKSGTRVRFRLVVSNLRGVVQMTSRHLVVHPIKLPKMAHLNDKSVYEILAQMNDKSV